MSDNNFGNVVGSLMKGMETFLSTKTVVGEPTQVGDTIILPLVDPQRTDEVGEYQKSGFYYQID